MKKRQVGKLQIILGILVLIISIVGLIIANDWNKDRERLNKNLTEDLLYSYKSLENASTEIRTIVAIDYSNKIEENYNNYINRITLMILFSIITFVLSLILIAQGLSNTSKQ